MRAALCKASSRRRRSAQPGFTLIEVMIAMVVLAVGLAGLAAVFGYAVASAKSAEEDVVAKQLASEAMESIFTARQTTQVPWAVIKNAGSGDTPDGIFLRGFQSIHQAGADGIYGTNDDLAAPLRTLTIAGPDGILGTADDRTRSLVNFQRQIDIQPVNGTDAVRTITVTVKYTVSAAHLPKSYVLTTYISQFR